MFFIKLPLNKKLNNIYNNKNVNILINKKRLFNIACLFYLTDNKMRTNILIVHFVDKKIIN